MSLAANNGPPTKQQHVPAWKRIGLKLKYAKDTSGDLSPQQTHTQNGTMQTEITGLSNGDQEASRQPLNSRPSKKRKTGIEPSASTARVSPRELELRTPTAAQSLVASTEPAANNRTHEPGLSIREQNIPLQDPAASTDRFSASQRRKKSVTFTPETKQEDTFSTSTSVKQRPTDQQTTTLDESAAQEVPLPSKQSKKEKKRRKSKHLEGKSDDGHSPDKEIQNAALNEVPEYVRYLELFHSDKAAWKFNKNKQKDLLKNIFNVHVVTPQHNEAIMSYVSSLQGVAVRQRVVESASDVLKAIAEKDESVELASMESEEARREAYGAALRRQIEQYEQSGSRRSEYDEHQLEELRNELERGKRAEAILGQLLQEELYPAQQHALQQAQTPVRETNHGAKASTSNNSTPKPKTKRNKRKSRTQVSDDSSSDSEGDFNPTRGPATVHDALSARLDLKLVPPLKRRLSPSPHPTANKKIIFDDDLLDKMFPKPNGVDQSTSQRKSKEGSKAKGFAHGHGTRGDWSESEDSNGSDE